MTSPDVPAPPPCPSRATAERLAVPVVSCVAAGMPPVPLAGLSRPEIEALVVVLAENIDPAQLLAAVTGRRPAARRKPGPRSRLERADDGIVDDVAVEAVASGERLVPLTPTERLLAAERILASGGGASLIGKRLHVNGTVAAALAAQAAAWHQAQAAA